jgi:uncharacterized membrane protein
MNTFFKPGRFLLALPMLIFPVLHFIYPAFVASIIPPWILLHLFWTYFTAVTLFFAGIAIIFRKYGQPVGVLLGIEIFLFCALIHGELLFHGAGDAWAESGIFPKLMSDRLVNAFKDFGMCGAAFIFAATQPITWKLFTRDKLLLIGRIILAISVAAFGLLHFIYPVYAPGIPPMTTDIGFFIPGHLFWVYSTGALLLVAGLIILIGKETRTLVLWLGALTLLFDILVWVPRFGAHPGDLWGNWLKDLGVIGGIFILADALALKQA